MPDFNKIAKKWQKKWEEDKVFKVTEDPKRSKFYCLEMYPYPSGKLHIGHARNYAIGDSYARFKRMKGFNVLYPMGYDAFGMPAENAAIQSKTHPKKWTVDSMESMRTAQKELGLSYDWDRELASCDPEYYKWNQWMFLKMLEKGLAYRKKAPINWCPSCSTVLANEQVEDGRCWRCSSEVEEKDLEQWFLKITDYADELLEDLDKLESWPDKVKIMQTNWIGKSHGLTINFKIKDTKKTISTYTTRPDTVFGITALVFALEHPMVPELVKGTEYEGKVLDFVKEQKKRSLIERTAEGKEKFGMFLGRYFINPVNGEECPLYVADYALMEYGTGAVMVVPAHDQRDLDFALKYDIPVRIVISPTNYELTEEKMRKMKRAFVDDGVLVNSADFDGTSNWDAVEEISDWMEKQGWGKRTINYKLRDWLISRQRYWGTPIPIIYCKKCGVVPVPYGDLPVMLPEEVEFTGEGNPLSVCEEFVNTVCPRCGELAKRETDTMDTFIDSSWYFFRFCSAKESKHMFSQAAADYWMPVDQYIGGIEHAILHLLYARFFTKVLRDFGMTRIDEPFSRLLTQGMVINDGKKMSKSFGNVVEPKKYIDKYGADTIRLYMLFTALPEKELDWSDQGVHGMFRFLNRVWQVCTHKAKFRKDVNTKDRYIEGKLHRTLKRVTDLIEGFRLSLAVGAVMEFTVDMQKYIEEPVNQKVYEAATGNLLLMLSPFAPHIAEELWRKIGRKGYISLQEWPMHDPGKIDEDAEQCEHMVRQTVKDIQSVMELTRIKKPKTIRIFMAEPWKYEVFEKLKEELRHTYEVKKLMKDVMIKEHSKQISKIVPAVVKDMSKMPLKVLDQEKEHQALKEAGLEKLYGADVEFYPAEKSREPKAKQAMPGRPAILLEV
jgi:leucyl-tRNA synthetase